MDEDVNENSDAIEQLDEVMICVFFSFVWFLPREWLLLIEVSFFAGGLIS